ncbi:MAG: Uma2 family endonuclease [Bernardetiaceae bacterium]
MQLIEKIALLQPYHHQQLVQWVDALLQKKPLYPPKAAYQAEDILKILEHFPKDKAWTAKELDDEHIFPPQLTVKIELIDYTICLMPDPTSSHQEILTNVATYINIFVRKNKIGKVYVAPFSLHIDEGNVRKPDIVLVLSHKTERVTERGIYEAPDLVVEVISPANYKKLRAEKKTAYAQFGVSEYWEIYPSTQEIHVAVLEDAEYRAFSVASPEGNDRIYSKILPGFTLALAEVF